MQVHAFENNGYRILLDVSSGSVHVVDEIVYDAVTYINGLLASEEERAKITSLTPGGRFRLEFPSEQTADYLMRKYPEQDAREAVGEIKELIDAKVLYTDSDYRPAIESFADRPTVVKALCLHIAHDCNLRCKYCFADEGEYHGRKALMSFEVGKKALDFLVANSGSRRNLEVDFFGGEPLLNFDVVKQITAYGRSLEKQYDKHFRFTLTTNGVLLNDDAADFANRELDNVVLSLDGRKEVHDRMRPFPGGKGSYDTVMPKFQKFVEKREGRKYYLRGTFTRYNKDFAEDVLHMADLGFDQLSMEPVVAPNEEPYSLREEDVPAICEQYDVLAKEMIRREKEGKGFQFFHFMIDLSGGPCVYKRLSGCGSGTEYLAVTPWGDLYPCHQFVGQEEFLLGNVDEGILRKDIVKRFKSVNVYAKKECQECFARFYCSGGCAANAWNFTKDLNGNYRVGCELERKRVECAIMMKAAEAERIEENAEPA
ncbi:MAG: thioether cross-link-forming SCIFF peptide maturase [Lachnospiraceae bacterium]|nr:thioether cross-link-forming SCIFF peptide maturase [Lachnospiraceae bacterium]